MITRERIKPAANVPLVVTLEDLNAPESHSQYTGLEYRYNVQAEDGTLCFVYLPPQAHQQIQKSMAQPGDRIEIVKSQRGYAIQVLSDAAEPTQPSNLRGHYPAGSASNGAVRVLPLNGTRPPAQPIDGNGRNHPESHPMIELMTKCLVYGAQVNWTAYQQVRQAGIEMEPPTWESARATGSSLFIERNKQRGGGAA